MFQLYHWIEAETRTMDTFLYFDRRVLRQILCDKPWYTPAQRGARDYRTDFARALSRYPHVAAFCRRKAPECAPFLDEIARIDVSRVTEQEAREAQTALLAALETYVVYTEPETMDALAYIRNWNPDSLRALVPLEDRLVLDVGAGTGRLAFAAARYARRVYASEPCDTLREYMRDRIRREGLTNVKVLDGEVQNLPFEDGLFDVVLCGHVVGDDYDAALAELERVTKDGGILACCSGEEAFGVTEPDAQLLSRGFTVLPRSSAAGERLFDYRKTVRR